MGLFLTAMVWGSPNASYSESSCKSTVENMVDICKNTPIMVDIGTLLITPTDRVLAKPIHLMSEFFNEFGIEVVKAVITLFVVMIRLVLFLFLHHILKRCKLKTANQYLRQPPLQQEYCFSYLQ
ncbi:MAG TPA: hypothetical protein VHH33_03385 [Nitrososphaeraceae archaeon]|jgi:hypothetical protein|nr:hypothetical protein [Nitrososphaeraceae archaeon]